MTTSNSSNSSARPKVLILGALHARPEVVAELKGWADIYQLPPMSKEEAGPAIRKIAEEHGPFTGLVAVYTYADPYPWSFQKAQMAPLFPGPKIVCCTAVGYNNIDMAWLTEEGAYYANSPYEIGRRTADFTVVMVLDALRGLSTQLLHARAGIWTSNAVTVIDQREATLGIIGMGNIGSQVADMCAALGISIIYSNRKQDPSSRYEYVTQDELYRRSDVVLLLTPLTDETRHLIDEKAIAKMKDGVIIVNVARGPVINEQHLVDALESGKVLRAALDVFEHEPEIHPKLKTNENVLITPHIAPLTKNIERDTSAEALQNVIQFFKTGKPNTPVNEPRLSKSTPLHPEP